MKTLSVQDVNTFVELQAELKSFIVKQTESLGFEICGIAETKGTDISNFIDAWIEKGYCADLHWLKKTADKRKSIKLWFFDALSVLVVGKNYNHTCNISWVSKYAHGVDYHIILKEKLKSLVHILCLMIEGFNYKISVDTGAVHEKSWAIRAGLGWQGKNTLVINPELGSWFYIGLVAMNIKLPPDREMQSRCGDCSLCIQQCPTQALSEPGILNCNKCISYHTIENKGNIPQNIACKINNTIFGCDICQKVCPWNSNSLISNESWLCHNNDTFSIDKLKNVTKEKFAIEFQQSALSRLSVDQIKRNIEIYKSNKRES